MEAGKREPTGKTAMILNWRGILLAAMAGALLATVPPSPSEALFGLFKKKERVIVGGQQGPASVSPSEAAAKISEYRRKRGLPAVTVDAALTAIAASQAGAMARAGKMSHSLGGSFANRLSRGGYNAIIAAENLAAGPRNLDEAMDSWQRSRGHNANLLKAGVTEIGIAVAYAPNSRYGNFWALVLAAPDDRQVHEGPDAGPVVAVSPR
jgi:uncharacterized protein YkwD